MTSMRVRHSATSTRNDVARASSGAASSSATASDTDTVSTVTWDRSTSRHRPLGRAPQIGLGQVLGGDAGQEVGRVDDEVLVEPCLPGYRARGVLGERHEHVGGRGVGAALEQAGQQQVSLLPAGEVLVLVGRLAARQQPLGLQFDEDGGDEEELRELVEVDQLAPLRSGPARSRRPPGATGCRGCRPRARRRDAAAGRGDPRRWVSTPRRPLADDTETVRRVRASPRPRTGAEDTSGCVLPCRPMTRHLGR